MFTELANHQERFSQRAAADPVVDQEDSAHNNPV